MQEVEAWLLRRDGEDMARGAIARLRLGTIPIAAPQPDEVLLEPLYGCWEGNMGHAMAAQPVDICVLRGESEVVLGNAGVVRVLEVGSGIAHVRPGEVCVFFGGGQLDRFGYMELAHGYDLPRSVGLLARRMKAKGHNVIPIPTNSRYSLPQWAAFSLRYITAWSNWRMAHGCYRLQVPESLQPHPHVWSWGGGTSLAELELARLLGARSVLVSSTPAHRELAARKGIATIDKRSLGNIETDIDPSEMSPERRRDYVRAERNLRKLADELTGGEGVSIFVDYIGAPLWRAAWRILGRASVVTSAGWKAGTGISYNRATACVKRTHFIHTHYASVAEATDAVAFAEAHGWMPDVDDVWAWEDIGALAESYVEGRLSTYFPVFEINRPDPQGTAAAPGASSGAVPAEALLR